MTKPFYTESGEWVPYIMCLGFFSTIFIEMVVDYGFIYRYFKNCNSSRYFALHTIFNAWVVSQVAKDAWYLLINPMEGLELAYSEAGILTTAAISGFHVYHLIFFSNLSWEDWMHHTISSLFVPVIGMTFPFGRLACLCNFGMCGFPGGIDYFLLLLVKQKKIPSLVEKRINRYLNLVIRWPTQMLVTYIGLRAWWLGHFSFQSGLVNILMFFGCVLHCLNAIYYADKVIGNYHVRKYQVSEKIAQSKDSTEPSVNLDGPESMDSTT